MSEGINEIMGIASPAVAKALDDELERRVEAVMDLIDDWVGVWRDHEYYSTRYGEGEEDRKRAVEQKIRVLVAGSMVAEMNG